MEGHEQWRDSRDPMLAAGSTEKLPTAVVAEVPQNAGKARSKRSIC